MAGKHQKDRIFYGTTTLGEKGQVVIPAEARKTMGIEKGEKLLVFGMGHNMLTISKVANLEKLASRLSAKLKGLQEIIKKFNK